MAGGTGGGYGAGGGGAGDEEGSGGSGTQGIIVITYTPSGGDTSIGGYNPIYQCIIGGEDV